MAKKRGPGGKNQWRVRGEKRQIVKPKHSQKRRVATGHVRSDFWDRQDRNYLVRCVDCGRLAIRFPDAVCNAPHDDATYEHAGVCDYCIGQWSWDGTTGVGPKR
jgi:hypothetical protein